VYCFYLNSGSFII